MVMALPYIPPDRGPPHNNLVPPFKIVDDLNAINNYIKEGNLDIRLFRIGSRFREEILGGRSCLFLGITAHKPPPRKFPHETFLGCRRH
ncbi:hypothetical protein LSTR_LSTR001222 [Laodelphax striatellus]|uniref:Uncharacterized protein n=1 Tax=Laodelphax striatellus TaxID=195883 RepID=A0A482XB41_LAOST|nr:hypothetical protein LSTR_LSTR001222 [Laodelphax striatellus]